MHINVSFKCCATTIPPNYSYFVTSFFFSKKPYLLVWKKLEDKVFSRVEIVSRIGREKTLRHSHRDTIGRWVFRSCGHRKQTCRWFGGLKMESTFSSWYITRNKTFALLRVHTIVTTTRTFCAHVPLHVYRGDIAVDIPWAPIHSSPFAWICNKIKRLALLPPKRIPLRARRGRHSGKLRLGLPFVARVRKPLFLAMVFMSMRGRSTLLPSPRVVASARERATTRRALSSLPSERGWYRGAAGTWGISGLILTRTHAMNHVTLFTGVKSTLVEAV